MDYCKNNWGSTQALTPISEYLTTEQLTRLPGIPSGEWTGQKIYWSKLSADHESVIIFEGVNKAASPLFQQQKYILKAGWTCLVYISDGYEWQPPVPNPFANEIDWTNVLLIGGVATAATVIGVLWWRSE